jgi:hypothetical protein
MMTLKTSFENFVYGIKAFCMLSFGWLFASQDNYMRYVIAYNIVNNNREDALRIIEENKQQEHITT